VSAAGSPSATTAPAPTLPVIGEIGPSTDGSDEPFWTALESGTLELPQCRACARYVWPVSARCAGCGSTDIGWTAVDQRGRVYSWTRTWHAFAADVADHVPYLIVLVEVADTGVRLLGMLLDDEVHIGDEVEGVVQPPSQLTTGVAVLRWRIAKEAGA